MVVVVVVVVAAGRARPGCANVSLYARGGPLLLLPRPGTQRTAAEAAGSWSRELRLAAARPAAAAWLLSCW